MMTPEKLTSLNLQQVLELESTLGDIPYEQYDAASLELILNDASDCAAFGVFNDDELIGWCSYRHNSSRYNSHSGVYEIASVVVSPHHREKGIGSTLLRSLIRELGAMPGLQRIYLTVSPDNLAALFLYLRHDFVISDFHRDFYGTGAHRVELSYPIEMLLHPDSQTFESPGGR